MVFEYLWVFAKTVNGWKSLITFAKTSVHYRLFESALNTPRRLAITLPNLYDESIMAILQQTICSWWSELFFSINKSNLFHWHKSKSYDYCPHCFPNNNRLLYHQKIIHSVWRTVYWKTALISFHRIQK